ncbi:MAG TPA: hypothetical protein VHP57_09540, partial [Acidimicrobiia bacterium]|nr:hypothetical protein [Acidimicrobiia bacterium]
MQAATQPPPSLHWTGTGTDTVVEPVGLTTAWGHDPDGEALATRMVHVPYGKAALTEPVASVVPRAIVSPLEHPASEPCTAETVFPTTGTELAVTVTATVETGRVTEAAPPGL